MLYHCIYELAPGSTGESDPGEIAGSTWKTLMFDFYPYPFLVMILSGPLVGLVIGLASRHSPGQAMTDVIVTGLCGLAAARLFWPFVAALSPSAVEQLASLGAIGMAIFVSVPALAGLCGIAILGGIRRLPYASLVGQSGREWTGGKP
jgi:hypothetical protein